MLKLGYLGPPGTFSEEAANIWSKGQFELVPLWPFSALFDALLGREIARAIMPIENSLGGEVGEIVDFLINNTRDGNSLAITGELLLLVKHILLVKPGVQIEEVQRVISHPQALAQCYGFLKEHGWEKIESASTAKAAEMVAESKDHSLAAIASPAAQDRYQLVSLAEDIGDSKNNVTRFVFVGGPLPTPSGADKTTIFFETEDKPGALYQPLGVFFYNDINLTQISRRTSKRRLGDYIFWVDAVGHYKDDALKSAIKQLTERFTKELWIAGSYPKANSLGGE